jgi:hypothetical protein
VKKKVDKRAEQCAEYYEALIAALRYVAGRCGYALGIHGTLRRDIDLIAAPWRSSAIDAASLIDDIRKATEAIVGTARFRKYEAQPEKKPLGRLAWSIYLTHDDRGPYLDISVMPKGRKSRAAK